MSSHVHAFRKPVGIVLAALSLAVGAAADHGSEHALRLAGVAGAERDRVLIPIDDDLPGSAGSAPCDVGAASFTLELWVRGTLAENATAHAGGGALPYAAWRDGNVLLDRSLTGASARQFGVSLAGGRVRFGLGAGDGGPDAGLTIEGALDVLDGVWHHIACVRDAANGQAHVYVDGVLDASSAAGVSTADLSYPDDGLGGVSVRDPQLAVGAGKADTDAPFTGALDELRVWNSALDAAALRQRYYRIVPSSDAGLVGSWRLEEGQGSALADSSAAGSPAGVLFTGAAFDGEWLDAGDGLDRTAPVVATILPPGFDLEALTGQLADLTCLACAPDGRVFVGDHNGLVRVVENGALQPVPLIQLPAGVSELGRGLLGLCLSPDFALNGHLFAYYTTTEPRNRVSRFTVSGATASPGSEVVLWQNSELADIDHLGGGIDVGADGFLYISTGDQFISSNSQNLSNEHGKLLRVALDGTIPADNPFVGIPGARPTIYARGLRNAFRLFADRVTGRVWIGDVGGNKLQAWEELHEAAVAANYGWPFQEGADCGAISCSQAVPPIFAYRHSDLTYAVDRPQGAVICGPVWRHPSLPAGYDGSLYFGDYVGGWIRRGTFDAQGAWTGDYEFLARGEAEGVVDIDVGADGALYFVTFSGEVGSGALYAVRPTGANQSPVALAEAGATQGLAPLSVPFRGSLSYDPERAALTYAWDFGDGQSSNAADPVHVYAQTGAYRARLVVSDGARTHASRELLITVGEPPVPAITWPPDGYQYVAGEQIVFTGVASDAQDGPLPPSALSWSSDIQHGDHYHPNPSTRVEGSDTGLLAVPIKGAHTPEDAHYRLNLTATDSDGLTATATHQLWPTTAPMQFVTTPAGIPLYIDGQLEPTPRSYQSLVGYRHLIEAPRVWRLGSSIWVYRHWSNAGSVEQLFQVPPGGTTVTATYMIGHLHTTSSLLGSAARNAQWEPSLGQSYSSPLDPFALRLQRDVSGATQVAFLFNLNVPRRSIIVEARLELVARSNAAGAPMATVWSYDSSAPPPFVAGTPTSLAQHAALTRSDVRWDLSGALAGQTLVSPDITPLVQKIVDRQDWDPNDVLGLVLDAGATRGAGGIDLANFASGMLPRLVVRPVRFRAPPPPPNGGE